MVMIGSLSLDLSNKILDNLIELMRFGFSSQQFMAKAIHLLILAVPE